MPHPRLAPPPPWTTCATASTRSDNNSPTPWSAFDLAALEADAALLERQSAQPDFWNDSDRARAAMRRLAQHQRTIHAWRGIEQRLHDADELIQLALIESADDFRQDLQSELDHIADELQTQAFALAFNGPYDARDAIIDIYGGAGGTESHDWAQMLLRMYQRWAERAGFQTELLNSVDGDEAGLRNATLEIRNGPDDRPGGPYGWLRSEHGVHRLVRISPF